MKKRKDRDPFRKNVREEKTQKSSFPLVRVLTVVLVLVLVLGIEIVMLVLVLGRMVMLELELELELELTLELLSVSLGLAPGFVSEIRQRGGKGGKGTYLLNSRCVCRSHERGRRRQTRGRRRRGGGRGRKGSGSRRRGFNIRTDHRHPRAGYFPDGGVAGCG